MGTRADFYVASGEPLDLSLEYLGTISSDGYEIGNVADADTERKFRGRVRKLLRERGGAKFPKVNSLMTDYVFVWVPGHGIVHRSNDDSLELMERYAAPDCGGGVYVSLARENELHALAHESLDENDNYTIPEWDPHYGFRNAARIEGIRYCYPDNREAIGHVVRFGDRDD